MALAVVLARPFQAQAAGTRADSTISNTASASFDNGAYAVSAATVSLVKTATIVDPFGGSEPVPGHETRAATFRTKID